MVKQVTDSVGDVDCAVFVTDPLGEVTEAEMQLIENIRQLHLPAILSSTRLIPCRIRKIWSKDGDHFQNV